MAKSVLGNIRLSGEFAGGMAPQPSPSGVLTVTGTAVDNTDPKNPVVNDPAIADVSGLTAALNAKLTATQMPAQANSVAADVPTLVADFNALLAKLRTAGMLAP